MHGCEVGQPSSFQRRIHLYRKSNQAILSNDDNGTRLLRLYARYLNLPSLCAIIDIKTFIDTNIGVLSGRLISMEGVKTFMLLGGAFVGQAARPLRQRLYIFYARVLIVYEYSSSGQAIFYKSIARVKGDVSGN